MLDISDLLASHGLPSILATADLGEVGKLRVTYPHPAHYSELKLLDEGIYELDVERDRYWPDGNHPMTDCLVIPQGAKKIIFGKLTEVSEEESSRRWNEFLGDYFSGRED